MRGLLILGAMILGLAPAARAATYEVKMMSRAPDGDHMVFVPDLLHVEIGDTVHFVPMDRGHNVASIEGMIPLGAKPWKGKLHHDVTVTLDTPGVYGFRCIPHYAMGMVGLIVVEDAAVNLDAAKARPHSGKPRLAFTRLFERLAAERAASSP